MCSVLLTLFDSKEDLISREILDSLNLEDFRNLDSSIYNHERRRKLLDCFSGHTFEGSRDVPLGDVFLVWARKRGISIEKLSWKLESENSISFLVDLCEHQGWNLKTLTISFEESIFTKVGGLHGFASIMKHSSNLVDLNFLGYASMAHKSLFHKLREMFLHFHYKNSITTGIFYSIKKMNIHSNMNVHSNMNLHRHRNSESSGHSANVKNDYDDMLMA
jgi:hypothetical protein